MSPVAALLIAGLLAAASIPLFRPGRGLFWRWWRGLRVSERVRIEDALKHVYDCEYRGQACTLQSLSGTLELGPQQVAELVRRLEGMELIVSTEGGYALTVAGRRDALRVIRLHRLWELYLADETGIDAAEWHARAEIAEHQLSVPEAESLARQMGYPRYDPHGDPIPTADGEIGPPRGVPLNQLPVGAHAEIVHVEDEPDAIYAQLVAERIHVGMQVHLLEKTPEAIRFVASGEEYVLAPVFAANLSAVELVASKVIERDTEKLSNLPLGEAGRVVGISPQCRGAERRRLLDLGVLPGTTVIPELRSPGGDPVGYRIRGAVIALRREQADLIEIDPGRHEASP